MSDENRERSVCERERDRSGFTATQRGGARGWHWQRVHFLSDNDHHNNNNNNTTVRVSNTAESYRHTHTHTGDRSRVATA